MRILIFGINHQIQPATIQSGSVSGKLEEFERNQKETYGALVRKKIVERAIEFIGEEAKHGQQTVSERVCALENCRYANIEMPPDERVARNIPTGYNENPDLPAPEKARFNQEREEYMALRAIAEADSASSIMVICGSMHTAALAERFRAARHEVETMDLHEQEWYVHDWQDHMMYNLD